MRDSTQLTQSAATELKKLNDELAAMSENIKLIACTSQVCATRANAMEWRQCLDAISSWHKCSPQAAHAIWRADGS